MDDNDLKRQLEGLFSDLSDAAEAAEPTAPVPGTNGDGQGRPARRLPQDDAGWYQLFYEDTPAMYFALDTAGTVLSVNRHGAEQLGFTAEELVGQPVLTVVFEADRQALLQQLAVCAQKLNQAFRWELRKVRRDGSLIWVKEAARAVTDADGQTVILVVCEDITEHKQTEAELLRFKLGIERSHDAIFLTDIDGTIFHVNDAFTQVYGFTQAEALGKTPRIIKSGLIPPEAYRQFWETLLAKKTVAGEILNRTKDGRLIHVEASNNPVLDEAGNIVGFLAIHRDITERKQAEALMARRALQLETVARVGTAVSTILEPGELLQTVVDLTKSNFDLYHAHVYVLNPAADSLELTAGAGEIGRQLVAEGWHIPLDREHSLVARAARSREAVIANDVRASADFLSNPLLPSTRSELAVPMIVGDRVLGVLDVQSSEVDHFDEDDARILSTLAAQVAVALQNANQHEQMVRSVAQLERLYETGRAITFARSEAEIVTALVENVDHTNLDRIVVALLDDTEGGQRRAEVKGVWDRAGQEDRFLGNRFTDAHIPSIATLGPQDLLLVDDFATFEAIDNATRATFQYLGVKSAAILPLSTGQRLLGWLLLETTREARHFTRDEVRPFVTLAGQAAVAFESQRSFQQVRAALEDTAGLYRVAQALAQTGDEAQMYSTVLVEYLRHLNLQQGGVLRFDSDQRSGTLKAHMIDGELVEPGMRIPVAGNPSYDRLIASREPVVINDALADDLLAPLRDLTEELGIKSMLLVPIIVRGAVIGALGADATETIHEFTSREVAFVRAMADQLSIALENQQLLDENQRLLAETRAALAEVEATQRRYTVQAWEAYRAKKRVLAVETTRVTDAPPGAGERDGEGETRHDPPSSGEIRSSLVVPVSVRGAAIGLLGLQETGDRQWLPEEVALVEAIAEQFAQAAENLRLIDESQQRAAREARINEISEKIQRAQTLDEALQIAVKEVGLSLQAPQTTVQLAVETEE